MNFSDRIRFSKEIMKIATSLSRTIDDEDMSVFFNQLEEHPIELVIKGMDQALRDRDPDDPYIKTMMLTVPEIRGAIDRMTEIQEEEEGTIIGCKICKGIGWMTGMNGIGHLIAWPCECLYNSAKRALEKSGKRRSSMDRSIDAIKRKIVKAYEYHQKKWGMTKEKE